MSAVTAVVLLAPEFGGPEVLPVVERDIAPPGPGEVMIDVRAAGINPVDRKVVSAVGDGVRFVVGEEVLASDVRGGYASRVDVAARDVFAKPSAASVEEAGGLLAVGTTAVDLLEVGGVTVAGLGSGGRCWATGWFR